MAWYNKYVPWTKNGGGGWKGNIVLPQAANIGDVRIATDADSLMISISNCSRLGRVDHGPHGLASLSIICEYSIAEP